MMVLDEKTVGIWFLPTTETQDWMLAVRELEPNWKYELTWRFRYHIDDKVFDSKDRKSWYKATATTTREDVITKVRLLATALELASDLNVPLYELLNDGDIEKFSQKFMEAPFAYSRLATPEDVADLAGAADGNWAPPPSTVGHA